MGQAPSNPQVQERSRRSCGPAGSLDDEDEARFTYEQRRRQVQRESQRRGAPRTAQGYSPERFPPPRGSEATLIQEHVDRRQVPQKAKELCGLLRNLEKQMAEVRDFKVLGETYRRLSNWTWEHRTDGDLPKVLEFLAPESMFPAWRRQALEEAYMLLYEDMAKQGNVEAIEHLPEPPTSAERGDKKIPEGLLNTKSVRGARFTNNYEAGHPCCYRRRWEYDIRRTDKNDVGVLVNGQKKSVAGREIIATDFSQRACPCATDPLTRFVKSVFLTDGCCGRDGREKKGADLRAVTNQRLPRPKEAPRWPDPPRPASLPDLQQVAGDTSI